MSAQDEIRLRWQRRTAEWGPLREIPDHRQRGLRAMWQAEDREIMAAEARILLHTPGPAPSLCLSAVIRTYLELEDEGVVEPGQEQVAERMHVDARQLRRLTRWPPFRV